MPIFGAAVTHTHTIGTALHDHTSTTDIPPVTSWTTIARSSTPWTWGNPLFGTGATKQEPLCRGQRQLLLNHPQHQQRRGVKHWARRRQQVLRKRFQEQAGQQNQPTLAKATALPTSYSEMDNSSLVVLGRLGVHEAHKEILKRHIMAVDQCPYETAEKTYSLISKANKEYMFVLSLPYQIGIISALTVGCLSLPMVFHHGIASWFNHHFVTTDVPEPKDLETLLEVGSWTWNWMEPPLGTLSFFLLTFQFSRSQLDNLGIKPYTNRVKQWRAERLAEQFPQYDVNVVMAYSKSSTIHSSSSKNYTY